MRESLGTTGLILNEPLLWEKGRKGRCGFSLPRRDVESSPLSPELTGEGPDFRAKWTWYAITHDSPNGISVWIQGCTH